MYVIIESYLVTVLNPEMVNNSSEHCANLNAGTTSTKGQSTKKVPTSSSLVLTHSKLAY